MMIDLLVHFINYLCNNYIGNISFESLIFYDNAIDKQVCKSTCVVYSVVVLTHIRTLWQATLLFETLFL